MKMIRFATKGPTENTVHGAYNHYQGGAPPPQPGTCDRARAGRGGPGSIFRLHTTLPVRGGPEVPTPRRRVGPVLLRTSDLVPGLEAAQVLRRRPVQPDNAPCCRGSCRDTSQGRLRGLGAPVVWLEGRGAGTHPSLPLRPR